MSSTTGNQQQQPASEEKKSKMETTTGDQEIGNYRRSKIPIPLRSTTTDDVVSSPLPDAPPPSPPPPIGNHRGSEMDTTTATSSPPPVPFQVNSTSYHYVNANALANALKDGGTAWARLSNTRQAALLHVLQHKSPNALIELLISDSTVADDLRQIVDLGQKWHGSIKVLADVFANKSPEDLLNAFLDPPPRLDEEAHPLVVDHVPKQLPLGASTAARILAGGIGHKEGKCKTYQSLLLQCCKVFC